MGELTAYREGGEERNGNERGGEEEWSSSFALGIKKKSRRL